MIPEKFTLVPMRFGVSSGLLWGMRIDYDIATAYRIPYMIREIKFDYAMQQAREHPIFSEEDVYDT